MSKINDMNHAGLSLAMDCVLSYPAPFNTNPSAVNTNDKLPKCIKGDGSKFISILYMRSKYMGQVYFLVLYCCFIVLDYVYACLRLLV